MLGGTQEGRGERSMSSLAKLARAIAGGRVRQHCEERERKIQVRLLKCLCIYACVYVPLNVLCVCACVCVCVSVREREIVCISAFSSGICHTDFRAA